MVMEHKKPSKLPLIGVVAVFVGTPLLDRLLQEDNVWQWLGDNIVWIIGAVALLSFSYWFIVDQIKVTFSNERKSVDLKVGALEKEQKEKYDELVKVHAEGVTTLQKQADETNKWASRVHTRQGKIVEHVNTQSGWAKLVLRDDPPPGFWEQGEPE